MNKRFVGMAVLAAGLLFYCPKVEAAGYSEIGQYGRPGILVTEDTEEQIQEEIRLGELELLALLVEAEAGNQPFEGKCLVVDCVLNRVESDNFPDSISEVIYQEGQFSVVKNGGLDKAGWTITESDYAAVMYEVELHQNRQVLYFNNCAIVAGTGSKFQVGNQWFRGEG